MPFFQSPAFGIIAMVLVGASWCLIGLISGDAPKRKIEPALFQFFGFIVAGGVALLLMLATKSFPQCSFRAWMLAGVQLFIGVILNFPMLHQSSKNPVTDRIFFALASQLALSAIGFHSQTCQTCPTGQSF